MDNLLQAIEDMALEGYGVAWHDVYNEYRPFRVDYNIIEFWHDPEGCGSENFETAVKATHEEMLRQLGP